MSVKLECIGCREVKDFPQVEEYPVCDKCKAWEAQHRKEQEQEMINAHTCSLCGYVGPAIDEHHIHGRKNSDVTIRVCANCHREIHAGVRSI